MSMSKVAAVNSLLLEGEPNNISVDDFAGYIGYKPQSIIDAMNEVFWGEWGFEEVSSELVSGEKGQLAVAQVRVWLKGLDFKPVGWGQSNVTRGAIGDARKGSQTDAIKKALSYFSIGNRAYRGELPDPKEGKGKPAQTRTTQSAKPAATNGSAPKPVQETGTRPGNPADDTNSPYTWANVQALAKESELFIEKGSWGAFLRKSFPNVPAAEIEQSPAKRAIVAGEIKRMMENASVSAGK